MYVIYVFIYKYLANVQKNIKVKKQLHHFFCKLLGKTATALAKVRQSRKKYASSEKAMVPNPNVVEFITPRIIRLRSVRISIV